MKHWSPASAHCHPTPRLQAIQALGGLLDAAGDAREARSSEAVAVAKPARSSSDIVVESTANKILLIGVPGLALLFLAPYLLSKFLGFDLPTPF